MIITGIDPGTTHSGWITIHDGTPVDFAFEPNETVVAKLRGSKIRGTAWGKAQIVIEDVEARGMRLGRDTLETVKWIGRFDEACGGATLIYRRDVKLHICGDSRANDSGVRSAVIDIYGGKGTAIGKKAAPGRLYGVSGHIWQALALAICFQDQQTRETGLSQRGVNA